MNTRYLFLNILSAIFRGPRRMETPPLGICVCLVALISASCASPNYYPGRIIQIESGALEADIHKIADVAIQLGFEKVRNHEPNAVVVWGPDENRTISEHIERTLVVVSRVFRKMEFG